jgi:hypothetical protein
MLNTGAFNAMLYIITKIHTHKKRKFSINHSYYIDAEKSGFHNASFTCFYC